MSGNEGVLQFDVFSNVTFSLKDSLSFCKGNVVISKYFSKQELSFELPLILQFCLTTIWVYFVFMKVAMAVFCNLEIKYRYKT